MEFLFDIVAKNKKAITANAYCNCKEDDSTHWEVVVDENNIAYTFALREEVWDEFDKLHSI